MPNIGWKSIMERRCLPKRRKVVGEEKRKQEVKSAETTSVLFVEQTRNGELARRLQEGEDRLAGITGFRVRIVELAGTMLKRALPNTNPWAGGQCERQADV